MNHAPLELPSGSFELSDLERIGEQAANAANDRERAKIVRDGLTAANQRIDATAVPGMLPDHTLVPVNRVIQEGVQREVDGKPVTEGRIVVQEEVQVFDPAAAAEQQPGLEDANVAGADAAADTSSADAGA